jgi:hypothetical protein
MFKKLVTIGENNDKTKQTDLTWRKSFVQSGSTRQVFTVTSTTLDPCDRSGDSLAALWNLHGWSR